jgi:UDPglucose 6-dehydrogenase
VYDAARGIALEIEDYTVVAIKSTVPVGTNDEVDAIIRKLRPDADFAVVSNPSFCVRARQLRISSAQIAS